MAENILAFGGVYAIHNRANGKRYIGSAVRFRKRFNEHRNKLDRGVHENARLQNAYTKYGAEAFTFEVVEVVPDPAERIAREQFWLDMHGCANRHIGYNIYGVAGSPSGYKHSEESRAKMRESQRIRPPISDETRRRLSASLKGRERKPEWVEKHRASLTGYRHTPEARQRMGASRRGKKRSPESIEKIAAIHRGRKRSDETKAKMREAALRRWALKRQREVPK